MGSTSSSPRCHEGRDGEHCPEHNPCCYCHKPTGSESSSPEGDGGLSDMDALDLCHCGCQRRAHMGKPSGCNTHGFHEFALPHVHEWGDWAPDKLQPRNGLVYAWCPCGASKATRAELCGSCDAGLPMSCTCPAEPEEGVCVCGHPEGDHRAGLKPPHDGCNWCKDCPGYRTEPDFEIPPSIPRRPPYAVAYAVEGGALYEVALSGDATVIAEDGVLQIIHPSKAVLGITRVTPMSIEES